MASLKRTSTGYVSKKFLAPMVFKSDYKKLIGEWENIEMQSTEVYVPVVSGVSTPSSISNGWNAEVTEQSYGVSQIELPAYILQAKYKYSELDIANFSANIPGLGLAQLQDKMIDLAIGLRVRQLALHGVAANTGIVGTSTTANLASGTNWSEIQGGVLLAQLMTHISSLLSSVGNAGDRIVICGSIRLINHINLTLVNTDTYLKSGSTGTAGSALKAVIEEATGKKVEIVQDNTLGHGGAQGKDEHLLITIPTLNFDEQNGEFEVGMEFGGSITNTYMGVSNQTKLQNPEMYGFYSGMVSVTSTCGASLRKEASLVIKAAWSA